MKYFSIIIPIYNAEKYLIQSLNSIINQSFTDFELILVNDGSTDNSKQICEEYAEKDDRIKVITTKNQGSGPARNAGIAIATGKYCYFPDSDDLLIKDALKSMYEETQKCEADLYVFSYFISMRDNKKQIKKDRLNDLFLEDKIKLNYEEYMKDGNKYIQGAPWNKLFLRKNIENHKIRYPNLKRHQDEVFIIRYMNITKSVKFSNIPIYKYYLNDKKAEFNKFPKNYLDIRTELYKEFKNIIIPWNENNENVKYDIYYSYIKSVLKCFEYMHSEKWNMTKKEKLQYIQTNISNKEVCDALNFIVENKKQIKEFKKSKSIIHNLKTNFDFYQIKLMKKKKVKKIYNVSIILIKIRQIYMKLKY